ncbi:MAG: hypothetical protein JXR07_19190 [Reichenbachiella sp.]
MKPTSNYYPLLFVLLLLISCAEKKRVAINPPLPEIQPAFASLLFDAAEGGMLSTEKGTRIEIPSNAFIDSLGNIVEGEVELKYRELHDTKDIFLSGIPMEINSESKTEVLSSAVMWEVSAEQNGKSLTLDSANGKTIKTNVASNVLGEDYDLWNFDTEKGEWSNVSSVKPEPNPLRLEAKVKSDSTTQVLNGLDLSNAFVFNYYGLIDVWKPKDRVFNYYYGDKGYPSDRYTRKLKKRAEGFGLQWVQMMNDYESVVYYGKDYPVGMLVWETEKAIPNWVKNKKEGYFRCTKLSRHRYKIVFYKSYEKPIYSTIANIRMSLKDLYRIGKEDWERNLANLQAELEEQERKYATLTAVRRSFEISKMGIYNYDRLLNEQGDLMVKASFLLEGKEFENRDELMIYAYLSEQNSVIRYYPQDFKKFVLYPGANYKIFCVAGPGKMAYLPEDRFNKLLNAIPSLKNQENPEIVLDLILHDQIVNTGEEFDAFLKGLEVDQNKSISLLR